MSENLVSTSERAGVPGHFAGMHGVDADPGRENQAWPGPGLMLRLEGLAVLTAVVVLYARIFGGHWGLFWLLFFLPDVSFVGWIGGEQRWAATGYNLLHWEAAAVGLVLAGWLSGYAVLLQVGLIWLGHISFDRVVGYGLKYRWVFRRTHLQRV